VLLIPHEITITREVVKEKGEVEKYKKSEPPSERRQIRRLRAIA